MCVHCILLGSKRRMIKEILIGSNSDLIVAKLVQELANIDEHLNIKIVEDLSTVETLDERQLVIIDLSVYTNGIIDRVEQFKKRFPTIELVAVTYTNDEFIDLMLIRRGIDQVTCWEELPIIVSRHLNTQLQTTG